MANSKKEELAEPVSDELLMKLVRQGKFVKATGDQEKVSGKLQIVPADFKHKGVYSTNNGILAFADRFVGDVYVGLDSPQNESALNQAGYKRDFMTVPFSRGYNPASEVERHLDKLRD